jgi:hypothetical protein
MSDGNGKVCCILAVCCPPGSPAQLQALTDWFSAHAGLDADAAKHAATEILAAFDLAPAGSLASFKSEVARLARESQPPQKPA